MSEQSFVYVCSGAETADFHVTLPIPFADDEYHVMASLAGATDSFGIEVPDRLSGDRTPSRFRVKTTTAPHSGDRIEFAVFGKLFAKDASIDRRLNALLASGVQNGGWGRRLELPAGRFYLDDTVRFSQVAGQELVGQGARATRLVWRGPGDRPAFDFNRCQDCGISHLSLEVADSIINTDKSVQGLSCSGTTVTASATAHGFTVGQVVFISGASPSAYNGRYAVTTVPNANTFTYEVGSTLGTASGTIFAAQAATLLCGVRMYNAATALSARRNVSGVDPTASLLNIANHPFATGSHVRLTTTAGLPGPLEVATDYWVINVSDDAIALATSLDNAQAGTRIELTTNGSGIHTVHTTTRVVSGISTLSMQMTVTGHAFVTGSPIRLSTTGTLPAGLVSATDYWVIKVDANTISLAASFSDAVTSPPILVTIGDAGTGTHFVDGRVVPAQLSSRDFVEHSYFLFDRRARDGIQIVLDPATPAVDLKNDHHRLNKVQIQGYTDSGIVVQGDQSLAHVFTGCVVQARDTGQVGINSARQHLVDAAGVYRPGSFKFYGGTIMENQLADLYLARQSNGPIIVNGVHSEGSLRFLDMANFNQDTTNLSDRTHIELNSIKHHVPTGPGDGEVIRYYGNGPLIITSMDIGKQIDPVPYRIRFQSRPKAQGGPVAFRFDGTVSTIDRKALFTGRLPTDYAASYRHRGSNNNLPLIVSVDNGRQKPITEDDWLRVLGIVPRCWYRFGETEALAPDTVDLVDVGANRLNLNGHRFATGYGPVRVSNVGGTLPTPLSGTTDYYIRRINTNSIALHLTKADAIAGTNVVDITAANSGANTIAGTTGSDGSIFDCNRRLPPIDMLPNAFPFYRRTSGFSDEWAEFASGAIDQQFFLNNVTDVDPTSDSVAFLIHFRAVTTTGVDNRYLVTLGTGATGPGGGPNVRFDANGFMKGTIDGVPSPLGGHNYTAEGDYLLVAGHDRSRGGRFTIETDKELIVHGTPSLNVGNHLRKGIGTGSTAGTLATAGFQVGLFAVFVGVAAERLIAMGTEVHRRMGWSVTMRPTMASD